MDNARPADAGIARFAAMSRAHDIRSRHYDREFGGGSLREFRASRRCGLSILALCALLAACSSASPTTVGGDKDSAGDPVSSVAVEIPPRPTVAPPREPDIVDDPRLTAINVAKYMVESYVYANKTGDTSGWESYSAPDCEYCAEVVSTVADMRNAGEWTDGEVEVVEYLAGHLVGDEDSFGVHLLVKRTGVTAYTQNEIIEHGDSTFHVGVVVETVPSLRVSEFSVGAASGFPQG